MQHSALDGTSRKVWSAQVSKTSSGCLFEGDLLMCSLMQCGFVCVTSLIMLTLTHTLLFHRTRRTKSSNSLRLRSRYSASSVSSVIFCLGALKSCSCSSRASLRICSAVICKRREKDLSKKDVFLDWKRFHSTYGMHYQHLSARRDPSFAQRCAAEQEPRDDSRSQCRPLVISSHHPGETVGSHAHLTSSKNGTHLL